jgi:spermidine/putrescine transport system ATP-binding protein
MPTATTLSSTVSLRGVAKRYREHVALQPTDLEIRDGEFLCLLGPSGCGKTTLLSLIGGFIRPTEGTVHIADKRVDQLPPNRRDVNTVFQSYALFPHMTVAANVGFGLRMAGVAKPEIRTRVGEALEMVGLADKGARMPSALSGGQQQRVALARALVRRPSVLALDEPFGALDLNLRKRLQLELKQLHRELGITFVFVTHDQDEAMVMSDRVAIMSEGRIEQLAPPTEVYLRPRNRFVAEFVGESNIFELHSRSGAVTLASSVRVPDHLVPGDLSDGSHQVMVRPEFIALHGEPGEGRLPVRLVQTHFLGQSVRADLQVQGTDVTLTARLSGTPSEQLLGSEDRGTYFIEWDPKRAVVLDPNHH